MMKYSYVLAVILLMTACQSNVPSLPTKSESGFWYEAGYQDAISGMVVKDNSTLQEWFGNPQIDRETYLRGYQAGQSAFAVQITWKNGAKLEKLSRQLRWRRECGSAANSLAAKPALISFQR
nr:DUF2799 domain-containing protein [Pectobacterium sp. PL152]